MGNEEEVTGTSCLGEPLSRNLDALRGVCNKFRKDDDVDGVVSLFMIGAVEPELVDEVEFLRG